MGGSVENNAVRFRIDDLRCVPAEIRFISFEPLFGSISPLNLSNIHWVIVGGESGPWARPMEKEWVIVIKEQCYKKSAFFSSNGVASIKRKLEDYWKAEHKMKCPLNSPILEKKRSKTIRCIGFLLRCASLKPVRPSVIGYKRKYIQNIIIDNRVYNIIYYSVLFGD